MSKKGTITPKPGAKLKALKELESRISYLSLSVVENEEDAKAFKELVESIPSKIGDDPDSTKYLMDAFMRQADQCLSKSDEWLHRSMLFSNIISGLERGIIDYMTAHKLTTVYGETWRIESKKQHPAIIINDNLVPLEYRVQVFQPNEKLIHQHSAMGKPILGVEVKDRFLLVASVIKKGEANVHSKDA